MEKKTNNSIKLKLKNQLKNIDKQLSLFGKLVENNPDAINLSLPTQDYKGSFYEFALRKGDTEEFLSSIPTNKNIAELQRNYKCNYMNKNLKKNKMYKSASSFNNDIIEDILHEDKDKIFVKCNPHGNYNNITYGEITNETYPYLFPLTPFRHYIINKNDFIKYAKNGILTQEDVISFTMINNIDSTDNNGWNALMKACKNNHFNTVKLLLDNGANVNKKDKDGWNAIMRACMNNNINITRLLLDNGADVNMTSNYGFTPLIIASSKGNADIINLLINYGAQIDHSDNKGVTSLMFAVNNGNLNSVLLLIENNANINKTNIKGGTALMEAIHAGHIDIARILINNGANINTKDIEDNTPLSMALMNEQEEIVSMIRSRSSI